MTELYHDSNPAVSIPPAQYTTTQTGSAVDLKGYNGATIVVVFGAIAAGSGTNKFTFSLAECDTLAGAYTAVDSTAYIVESDDWDLIMDDNAVFAGAVKHFAYVRKKADQRYIKVVATHAASPDAFFTAIVLRTHPEVAPTK